MDDSAAQQVQIVPPVRKTAKLPWILVVVLFLAAIAGFGMYVMSLKQVQDATAEKLSVETKLQQTQAKLDEVNKKLASAVFLPKGSEMSPQCRSGNNDNTRLAPVNTEPIDGYSVYLVNCVKELAAGDTNTGKVIVFQVNNDGSRKFVFGAGSGEPYCVSSKIIGNVTAVQNISQKTGLPICKTF